MLHAGIDVLTPLHEFAASFFKTAAEPTSPLSPFSAESSGPREAAIDLYAEVLAGSTAKIDAELRPQLPELLWLAYMGMVLFWVYDRSPGQTRTREPIDGAVPLVDRLVRLSRLRVLRPVTQQVISLIHTLRHRPKRAGKGTPSQVKSTIGQQQDGGGGLPSGFWIRSVIGIEA
ncbi:TetR family transcriptional regulator C-terminal domain-containing protein [Verrucosispora sp. WMMD573]|uniref:TetR family transcriptional regulator C-terminal domain-containing protein n=1 Tax=Verrucosispora sp. WMMD573 TaxID=3015149 RepID=UPI00248C32A0|nr:TetR family transcriptional regulator C-terminal domain-containing protein [Verrucosispora sp. WMMD573]WBB56821.1 TetR family transcriptional regulator C-terminal domain-containing protein [Verrucosispora sp. WMMD573]